MRQSTIKLLFWTAAAYAVLLLLVAGFFPSDSVPGLAITAIPVFLIAVFLILDLLGRTTAPSHLKITSHNNGPKSSPVEFLNGQIRVASTANDSYFESMVMTRLKELLISKAALETGLSSETVRQELSDQKKGLRLLNDPELYQMLYGRTPESSRARLRMIKEALDKIEAWKG